MVITKDSDSLDPGSIPGKTSQLFVFFSHRSIVERFTGPPVLL